MILPQSLIFIFGLSYLSSYDQIIKNTDVPPSGFEPSKFRSPRSRSMGSKTETLDFSVRATTNLLKQKNHRNKFSSLKLKNTI